MKSYDAIVVGGGLAGLTAAAYLSREGLSTLLCEKRAKTGGLVETFWHQGFAFDAGIRAFENSGILLPMLQDLGISLELTKNHVTVGMADRSVKLEDEASLENYTELLKVLFPDEAADIEEIKREIRKVMGYMDVLYGIDNPLFMRKFDRQYLTKTLLPWFFKYQVNIRKASKLQEPIESYMQRFTKNQALIDMIIQHFFKETPAFFALSYFSLYLDYSYPLGGTGQLAKKMTEYIEAAGGEVRTGAGVAQVDAQNHQLTLEGGEALQYKNLIWAADQKTLYSSIKGVQSGEVQKQRTLTQNSTGGDSVLTLFLGLNQEVTYFRERCGAHMFYTPSLEGLSTLKPRPQGDAETILAWTKHYLERTTYEIACPAVRDSTLAPTGKTGLIVSTLFDYDLVKSLSDQGAYESFKTLCAENIVTVLEGSLFEGIKEMTMFSLCATPLTLERETSNLQGAITGWAFTNAVMPAEDRFKNIREAVHTPLKDVYQCGQWTFSPSGLPVSIVTGKLAADQVAKKHKK